MEQPQESVLESFATEHIVERKKLLPKWIVVFCWIFPVLGGISVAAFIASFLLSSYSISLYGMESNEATSVTGIFLSLLFALKGVTAFGLLWEKDWAVNAAIADAVIGIVVCFIVMLTLQSFIRLELVVLIPYLVQMVQVRRKW